MGDFAKFQLEDRVSLRGLKLNPDGPEISGKIVGFGRQFESVCDMDTLEKRELMHNMVLVELDREYQHWYRNEMTNRAILYHSTIVVHESNLKLHIRVDIPRSR